MHGIELAASLVGILKTTLHVESSFGVGITSTFEELAEAFNGLLEVNKFAGVAREDLGHVEGLGEELLDLTGASNSHLIFFGEIVHTKNGNNILEGTVILEELLDTTGGVVMDLTNNGGVKHTGSGVKGIDSGVDTDFGKSTRQHSGGIKMSESGGGSGIGKIISGHIDSLDGGDGSGQGGGNALLEGTQIGGEGRLVTHSGGDTAEKGRDLGTGLGETEDVVNEKEHILVLFVTEVLGDGEASETDTGAGSWGLVHLTVHEGGLGSRAINFDDTRVDHLVVEIVTFTGTFTDTSEHGETTVSLGDVVNKLHDENGLADTSTTEKTNLSSLGVGAQKVDNLNAYIIILITIGKEPERPVGALG
jgi:hypothetical protein